MVSAIKRSPCSFIVYATKRTPYSYIVNNIKRTPCSNIFYKMKRTVCGLKRLYVLVLSITVNQIFILRSFATFWFSCLSLITYLMHVRFIWFYCAVISRDKVNAKVACYQNFHFLNTLKACSTTTGTTNKRKKLVTIDENATQAI